MQRIQELSAKGYSLDPITLIRERLDLVTSLVIAAGIIDEASLANDWEKQISSLLDLAEEQINTPKLVLPND